MDWKLALQLAGVVLGLLYLWLEYRADIRPGSWDSSCRWCTARSTINRDSTPTARCRSTTSWPDCTDSASGRKSRSLPNARPAASPARRPACGSAWPPPMRRSTRCLLPVARAFHGQHRSVLGQPHHGALHHGLLDAFAQIRRAMARVAGRGRRDGGGSISTKIFPSRRDCICSTRAGRRGLPALAQADRAMTKEGRSVERPSFVSFRHTPPQTVPRSGGAPATRLSLLHFQIEAFGQMPHSHAAMRQRRVTTAT